MATLDDVRRLALSLPGARAGADPLGHAVPVRGTDKGFAWSWKERVHPGRPRVPNLGVLAVRVAGVQDKELPFACDPQKFFTEPHYNGCPAILVGLDSVDVDELRELLTDAWLCTAPASLRSRLTD